MNDLLFLIQYLCKEKDGISIDYRIHHLDEAKEVYQNFCTIRFPKEVSSEFLDVESRFLDGELNKRGVVFWNSLFHNEKIGFWYGDITSLAIEAIVNPTTSDALGCFDPECLCINRRIHLNAGVLLRNECFEQMKNRKNLTVGEVISTSSYHLPCDTIFHVLFPNVQENFFEEQKLQLINCYINCLDIAREKNIRTIAFPCITFNTCEKHKKLTIEIVISAIKEYLKQYPDYFDFILFCVSSIDVYSDYMEVL